jgi:hypothetical protein
MSAARAARRSATRGVRAAGRSGYVLIVVLLLGALIVATTAAYARHTSVNWRQSTASLWVHETRESAQSGVAFARQVLAAGKTMGSSSVEAGDKTISVIVADAGGDKRSIHVDATSSGLGATIEAEARVFGRPGTSLPTLAGAAVTALNGDAKLIKYSGTQTVTGTTLTGNVLLQRGCQLTLKDVIVKGTIVSQLALAGPPYDPKFATSLTLQEGVRIDGGTLVPDCAILLPDGTVTADATSNVEIHGVVLADTLAVWGSGAMDGYIVAAKDFTLPSTVDRPGFGRTPPDWPAALTLGAFGLKSLAFRTDAPTHGDVEAIKTFVFPAK